MSINIADTGLTWMGFWIALWGSNLFVLNRLLKRLAVSGSNKEKGNRIFSELLVEIDLFLKFMIFHKKNWCFFSKIKSHKP